MNKIVLLIGLVILCALSAYAAPGLVYDGNTAIQGHACDPNRVIPLKPANTVFKRGSDGNVDITNWTSMEVYPTNDANVMFNNYTTGKVFSGQRNVILIHPNTSTIKIDQQLRGCGM